MTERERRSHRRIRARFPCAVELDGRRGAGTVRDLSAGGLCVQTDMSTQEGDELRLELHPKGRPSVEVRALVWNLIGMRSRRSGDRSARLGLVLSDATDAFLELLRSYERAPTQTAAQPTQPTPSMRKRPATKAEPPKRERKHRVRVKQSTGSRTRTLVVFAESLAEARERALEETGSDWAVLDVTPWGSRPGRP